MNKKVITIIAIEAIVLSAIIIGGLFLKNDENKIQDTGKSIDTPIKSVKDNSLLVTNKEEPSYPLLPEPVSNNGVKVEIIRGKKYCSYEQYPDMGYQQSIKVSYVDNDKKEKIIYTTSDKINSREVATYTKNDCLFLEHLDYLILSPDGKYLIFHKSVWEASKPYMINIDTENYVFGDKNDIFIIRDILWSSNNKNFVIITDVNEMAGAGKLGVYVSEYNNPDNIKVIWSAEDYLTADIKEANFVGTDKISFNVEQSECPSVGKVCPDGTEVIQIGSNCEFEDCAFKNKVKESPKKIIKYEYNFKENKLTQIN